MIIIEVTTFNINNLLTIYEKETDLDIQFCPLRGDNCTLLAHRP